MTESDPPRPAAAATSEPDIPEQYRIRQAKRERLLVQGRDPYPVEVARTHTLAEIRAAHPDLAADLVNPGHHAWVSGITSFA